MDEEKRGDRGQGIEERGPEAGRLGGADCPTLRSAAEALTASRDLARALRRLRRDLDHCRSCQVGGCQALREFHDQVNAALVEVMEEMHGN